MKIVMITTLIVLSNLVSGQKWIDQVYAVKTTQDIVYGHSTNFLGNDVEVTMDIFEPICPDQNAIRPLMIWVHGGAFVAGDKTEVNGLAKQFASRGYVTASINYRLGYVSDEAAWNCNFPNYSCLFATDTTEWMRAYYRCIQDAKGSVRYLVNHHQEYKIDPENIFICGESAGAFVALGVGLMDTEDEKLPQTFAQEAVNKPNNNSANCQHNVNQSIPTMIPRPDLGSIRGHIEPTNIHYTIKGIGNMFGGMMIDLLKNSSPNTPKPVIYSFHQPCDLIVPIDKGLIFKHFSWCMTNGYNCQSIKNVPMVYGSKAFSDLNTTYQYGYQIHNEFSGPDFPYNFLFGDGSCADQVNNPCHAYDNVVLRTGNLAKYFAPLITIQSPCGTSSTNENDATALYLYPNPVTDFLSIAIPNTWLNPSVKVHTMDGLEILNISQVEKTGLSINTVSWKEGMYFMHFYDNNKWVGSRKFIHVE